MSRFGIFIGLFVLTLGNAAGAGDISQIRWAPDLEAARKAAAQFRVPLLIHFYGDNCVPCKTLEMRVFSKPELVETLNKYFICVKINGSRDRQTAAQYQVHSWPTDVFIGPDGKTLYQGVCPQDLRGYMGILQNVAVMNRDRNMMLASENASQSTTTQSSPYAAQPQTKLVSTGGNSITQQSSVYANGSQQSPTLQTSAVAPASSLPAPSPVGTTTSATAPVTLPQAASSSSTQTGATNFTTRTNTQSPTLGPSRPPVSGVASGPVTTQPASITTAAAPAMASAPMAPSSNNAELGHMPARNVTGLIPPPGGAADGQGFMPSNYPANDKSISPSAFPNIPTVETSSTANAIQPVVTTGFTGQATSQNAGSRTVENPYFPNPQVTSKSSGSTPNCSPNDSCKSTQDNSAQDCEQPLQNMAAQQPASSTKINARLASYPLSTNGPAPAKSPSTSSSMPTMQSANLAATQQSGTDMQATVTPTSASTPQAEPMSTDQLGLEGYCPIALKNRTVWEEGKPEFAVQHRGKVYWMSTREAMEQFLAAPDEASPMLSGYDPYLLLEEGRLVAGSIEFGLHEENSDTYMLFASAETKQKYWEDFSRYSKALRALVQKLHENSK